MDPLWLNALNLTFGLSRTRALITHFGSAKKAWEARPSSFRTLNIKREALEEILKKRETLDPKEELEKLTKAGVGMLTMKDALYPAILKEIASPPLLLYYKGNPELLTATAIAIVGRNLLSLPASLLVAWAILIASIT